MRPSSLVTLCVLGTALPAATFAATLTIPEIVVTPTRTPIHVDQVAASTTVITREDIESQQAESVPELIQGTAGIDVVQSGGPGKATSFFLRGTESDHVLVLINGIRAGSVSAGTTAFEQLPVDHIERIEIVRGPRASQWGSEAIGGVIQIFTRSGEALEAGRASYEAGAGAGSYHTYTGSASTAGRTDASHYQASVGYVEAGGIDAREPVPGPFGFDQPDDDGYDNLSFHLRGGHRFNSQFDVEAFMLRAEGTTEFDGSFQDETDFVQQVLGTRATWQFTDNASVRLRAGESRDEQSSFAPDGSFASRFDSEREELSLLADIEPSPGHVVNVGVDYRDDKVDSDTPFTETSRHNTGVYAQYLGTYDRYTFTTSLRHDDNETFGTETTGGVGLSSNLSAGVKLYASYGTAFKTPSFNELFFPGFGNPGLVPETSESVELGIEQRRAWGWWSVRAYRTDVEDLIATVFDPATGVAFPENVDEARIDGVEAEIHASVAGFDVAAALNLMDHEDKATGNDLPRRPERSLSVDVSRRVGRLRAGGRLVALDDRFDNVANTVEVDSFVTVDLRAEYELSPGLFLRGRIGNLFDEDYETVATFNSPGRHAFLSVLYRNHP